MPKLLTVLSDLLFPPSDDQIQVRHAEIEHMTALYHPGQYKGVTFLTRYSHPLVQAAIKENKFHHNRRAASLLGSLLKHRDVARDTHTAFIPIPLGPKRLRARGHNQVATILEAAGLAEQTHTKIITRVTETLPQSHLNKKARVQNIQQAFAYCDNSESLNSFTRIILIDDVVTTGATLEAAYDTLLPHLPPHIKVDRLAFAH